MMMTDTEIARSFANRGGAAQSQIRILSELNCLAETLRRTAAGRDIKAINLLTRCNRDEISEVVNSEDMVVAKIDITGHSGAAAIRKIMERV